MTGSRLLGLALLLPLLGGCNMNRDGNYLAADQVVWSRKTGEVRANGSVVVMPTYDQVLAQMNEERVNLRARRYLRDLRRDAVIDFR